MDSSDRSSFRDRLLAIALASFAILFFQIAVTRVLSVVLWYHWAFLSVSLAMLGLGAPGVWFALRSPGVKVLRYTLLLGGLAVPGAVIAILKLAAYFGRDAAGNERFGDLPGGAVVACMGCVLVPMLLLGAGVCILLLRAQGRSLGRLYGADLLGAAIAAAAVMPLLNTVPTPIACALVGLFPVVAAWRCGCHWLPVSLAAAAILGVSAIEGPLKVTRSKLYSEVIEMHERWTSTARLTFFDTREAMKVLAPGATEAIAHAWGRGSKAPLVTARQFWMEQDGTAGTPITEFDGDIGDMSEFEFLMFDVTAFAYELLPPQRVSIIGGGGGRDILTALRCGASDIDVAEFNAGVVDTVSTRFKDFGGDVYHTEGVHAHVSEGRSFLTRSRGEYDLIQISLIDSWAATAAGAYTLAENNLYTVEAFQLYLDKLSDEGVLSTSRWRSGVFGLESDRLVLLSQAALRAAGFEQPGAHMMVIGADKVSTVLISKRPFTADEIARGQAVCAQRGFDLMYPDAPDASEPGHVTTVLKDGVADAEARGLLLSPPTDDRPFFFQSLPVFGKFDLEFARSMGVNEQGVATLQLLMIVVVGFTLALFFAPFLLMRWLPRAPQFWRGSSYFAVIGLSFMLIEIPWLQRFVLYLGHPSLAAAVVIGSLLLGAGCGSLRSTRLGVERSQRLWPIVPIALAIANASMSPMFTATLGASEAVRVAITVVFMLPIGFLLGHFFPLGMARFGDEAKAWYWALNGACGVLAGVCSLALAMALGFRAVAWIGVIGYVVAGVLFAGRRAVVAESA